MNQERLIQEDLVGYYLDGRTAIRQAAAIRLTPKGLQITVESGAVLWWPYNEIRQNQGFYGSEQVRLEKGRENPEVLWVGAAPYYKSLHLVAPELAKQFHGPSRREMRLAIPVFAAIASVAIVALIYFWGIPAGASLLASYVPVSWEEHLGKSVVEKLAPLNRQCPDPNRLQSINEIVKSITVPLPQTEYKFRVIVKDDPRVNALATPGGYIVIFRGLLEKTESAEELAGILAHELQHILHRHATRALLQQASTRLLLAAITGDANRAMAFGLEGARVLGTLRYSRQHEDEADAEAMQVLLAGGIDPQGMITFFERIMKEGEKSRKIPAYLSTHPSLESRIARLKALATQSERPSIELTQGSDWRYIRQICEKETSPPSSQEKASDFLHPE